MLPYARTGQALLCNLYDLLCNERIHDGHWKCGSDRSGALRRIAGIGRKGKGGAVEGAWIKVGEE